MEQRVDGGTVVTNKKNQSLLQCFNSTSSKIPDCTFFAQVLLLAQIRIVYSLSAICNKGNTNQGRSWGVLGNMYRRKTAWQSGEYPHFDTVQHRPPLLLLLLPPPSRLKNPGYAPDTNVHNKTNNRITNMTRTDIAGSQQWTAVFCKIRWPAVDLQVTFCLCFKTSHLKMNLVT